MSKWEYCVVTVAFYQSGGGEPRQELLSLTLPGGAPASVTNPHGSIGLLNQLGGQGWELVTASPQLFYLKRELK
jgi:hypothetical protein